MDPVEKSNSKTYFTSDRYHKTSHPLVLAVGQDNRHYRCHSTTIPAIRPMCPVLAYSTEVGYFLGAGVGWGWVYGAVGILGEESWYALVCPWARSCVRGASLTSESVCGCDRRVLWLSRRLV